MARATVGRLLGSALRAVARGTRDGIRAAGRAGRTGAGRARPADTRRPGSAYPGDFAGVVTPRYAPDLDGAPDPGEIVWTWVPYEEDHSQGKDRPVLLVGHDGPWLLGLMLSSRDHDTRPGPNGQAWLDIGTGSWDARRRPSEVRLDRVIRIDPQSVRREGAVLDRTRFDAVVGSLGGPRA
ncbi:type II toxin-antitoxin system PemK/MazF family toxin [Actinotalea sp. M2MS4P-6]|uniref:type II toxin-antitoxin system PemK/MazF family toxin n=1 Tax=Actinotalea sp. M2MS4P-6 TaxID=2983762 RepID=UPI0021E3F884|nr:type II toxin-antitoxin system PemK/MazF family toxin [Actinotalea sp. M2MS4P-6]MCV2393945.1 type II toxin-antitoxin system PemK/MazF family toxin [Actinotalea sp. M2MS4P-6]